MDRQAASRPLRHVGCPQSPVNYPKVVLLKRPATQVPSSYRIVYRHRQNSMGETVGLVTGKVGNCPGDGGLKMRELYGEKREVFPHEKRYSRCADWLTCGIYLSWRRFNVAT